MIICKIFGHHYKYNFKWMPSKCSCKRCNKKWVIVSNSKYNGKNLFEEDIYIWKEDIL